MALEITGRIVKLLPQQTGNGRNGTWVKQEFIVETNDQYPKQVCISTFGDKVNLSPYNPGDEVKVSVNIESREYNERWYTDVRAWRIEPAGAAAPQGAPRGGGAAASDDHFGAPPQSREGTFSVSDEDDLPF